MPRYFFDLADHDNRIDHEGVELESDDEARAEAVVFAGQLMRDHPEMAWDGSEMRVHLLDERSKPLFIVVVIGVDLTRENAAAND